MRSRFFAGRLPGINRLLLLLTVVWAIVGIPGNYFRLRGTGQDWMLLGLVLIATIAGVIAYSVIRRRHRPATYGFSFKSGGLISLAILAVIHVYLAISGKLDLAATDSFQLAAFSALMEEVAFRAIAIDSLILLMGGMKAKAHAAILASTILWCIPHVVSKPPSQLVGIFLGGLVFGYIYYKSRSILLPAWIHSAANAGYLGGLFIVALYCLVSVVDTAMRFWNKHTTPAAVAEH